MNTVHQHTDQYCKTSDSRWDADQQQLHIDLEPLLGKPSTLILSGWEAGILWSTVIEGETTVYSDPFGASPFPVEYFEHDLLNPWLATIPDNILALLKQYKGNAFGMLILVNRFPFARELFEQHPVLFWLVYTFAKDQSWQEHQFISCCRGKRADILKACGFPATPSAVKLLHKINGHYFNRYAYDIIQAIFQLESYSLLNHCNTVSLTMLASLTHMPETLYSKFVLNWQDAWSTEVSQLIKDTQRIGRTLRVGNYWHQLNQCKNADSLKRYHDQLVDQMNSLRRQGVYRASIPENVDYPSPPIAGNGSIIPIRNSVALQTESQEQNHCVASYHADIVSGYYYVYKVLLPAETF